jgi:antitoxin VapB
MIHSSQEAETLAQRLAAAKGIAIEEAITQAIEQSARAAGIFSQPGRPRDMSPYAIVGRRLRLDEIAEEIAKMPVLDPRSPRQIMDDINAL